MDCHRSLWILSNKMIYLAIFYLFFLSLDFFYFFPLTWHFWLRPSRITQFVVFSFKIYNNNSKKAKTFKTLTHKINQLINVPASLLHIHLYGCMHVYIYVCTPTAKNGKQMYISCAHIAFENKS